ncbi:MAG: hypothetical protein WBD58_09015 [Geitlerinemataceae cyanobacterium]
METILSPASLSCDPRLEVGETTGKKREASSDRAYAPDTTFCRSHEAPSCSFHGYHT